MRFKRQPVSRRRSCRLKGLFITEDVGGRQGHRVSFNMNLRLFTQPRKRVLGQARQRQDAVQFALHQCLTASIETAHWPRVPTRRAATCGLTGSSWTSRCRRGTGTPRPSHRGTAPNSLRQRRRPAHECGRIAQVEVGMRRQSAHAATVPAVAMSPEWKTTCPAQAGHHATWRGTRPALRLVGPVIPASTTKAASASVMLPAISN